MYLGGLCFITDQSIQKHPIDDTVRLVLEAGVKWIQYRDKEGSGREIHRNALRLRRLTRDFNAAFIVNDYADIACLAEADGVHLGQDDLPAEAARKIIGGDKLIGISTHSVEQAVAAEKSGAFYIGFGPIFHTATKDAGVPRGVQSLRELRRHVKIPIVAIGGISLENLRSVLEAGVDAVAVASAILKGDIKENARRFLEAIRSFESMSKQA